MIQCRQSTAVRAGILFSLIGLPAYVLSSACATICVVDARQVGTVRLGADKNEVITALANRYAVTDETPRGSATILVARLRGTRDGQPMFVVNLVNDRAFLIDSYDHCETADGVGPGVNLGRAQEIYGPGHLEPADLGYFVSFSKARGISFLIDPRDIPERLRAIPDDVLMSEQEREILGLAHAKIIAVRVTE
jgi:hypothetical protein